MRTIALVGLAVILFSASAPRPAAAQPAALTYTIADLGHLGGDEAWALAINARGQTVGFSWLAGHTQRHAFLYENGGLSDLGTLPTATESFAFAINRSGQAVGVAFFADGGQTPILFSDGQITDLAAAGWSGGIASGINASGQIVGWAWRAGGSYHAWLYEAGARRDLGTLGGSWSNANSINGSGEVAGYSQMNDGSSRGFRWSNGVMSPLGTLNGGSYSGSNDINAARDIAGWSGAGPGNTRPVLYRASDGAVVDLGTLGGTSNSAFALNDLGQVVGYSSTAGGRWHAFLYTGGVIRDLNELIPAGSGWELIAASGVNNAGQIVGWGCHGSAVVPPSSCSSGYPHAFVLTASASQMLANLIALVQSFGLPRGLENSLIVKLENAQKSLDEGNTDAACDQLDAFVNEVSAQDGKGLTSEQAGELLSGATGVKDAIGCP